MDLIDLHCGTAIPLFGCLVMNLTALSSAIQEHAVEEITLKYKIDSG